MTIWKVRHPQMKEIKPKEKDHLKKLSTTVKCQNSSVHKITKRGPRIQYSLK